METSGRNITPVVEQGANTTPQEGVPAGTAILDLPGEKQIIKSPHSPAEIEQAGKLLLEARDTVRECVAQTKLQSEAAAQEQADLPRIVRALARLDNDELHALADKIEALDEEDTGRMTNLILMGVGESSGTTSQRFDPENVALPLRRLADWLHARTIREKLAVTIAFQLIDGQLQEKVREAGVYDGDFGSDVVETWRADVKAADLEPEDVYAEQTTALLMCLTE